MRVWVYPERTWEELGAERWEAEWYDVPANWALLSEEQREEVDPADFPRVYEEFRGNGAREKALKRVKRAVNSGRTAFGCGTVQRQVVDWYVEEDRIAEWVNVGDTEYWP